MHPQQTTTSPRHGMADVVNRNIRALIERRRAEENHRRLRDRIADRITAFTGSMRFVYIHLVLFGLWLIINLGWLSIIPIFDPSFVILAMVASVEAIFLSTFVLITQNRMAAIADKRADLDLQISLLAEHEITRLITLVRAMAERMDIKESQNPELSELAEDVQPEKVLDTIEENSRSGF
jgi:uncharacterized membrane protein